MSRLIICKFKKNNINEKADNQTKMIICFLILIFDIV